MLLEPEIFNISFSELKRVWRSLGRFKLIVVGGWAAHLLINEAFRRERKREYIGSKDIEVAVLSSDLPEAFRAAERLGFFPLSFRYCRIYSRSKKRFIGEREAKEYPLHDLFYLFLDFITDRKPKMDLTVFEDELVGFALENGLFVEREGVRVMAPEPLILSKVRMLGERDEEKRVKDILDAVVVSVFYEGFEASLFRELSGRFKFDKGLVKRELARARESFGLLGLSKAETANLLVSFTSLLRIHSSMRFITSSIAETSRISSPHPWFSDHWFRSISTGS